MIEEYRLRVRKEVEGIGELTIVLEVEATSKRDAEKKFKSIVHTSWRWLEIRKVDPVKA